MMETPIKFDDAPPRRGLPDVGGALAFALSIVVSVSAYTALPGRIRIHWSFGAPYYGPEFAPTPAVLLAFPLFVAAVYVAGRWLGTRLERAGAFEAVRPYYDWGVLLTMAGVVLVQVVLVWANL